MKVVGMTVGRTKGMPNGEFGSRTLNLTVEMDSKDGLDESIDSMLGYIDYKLGDSDVNPLAKKNSKSSTSEGKPFTNEKPATPAEEAPAEMTAAEKAEEKKAKAAEKRKAAAAAKKAKNKAVPYNRELNAHKDEFAAALTTIAENWKAAKRGLKSAKETSVEVAGLDMFTSKEDKTILPSFMEALEKSFKKHYEANKDI